MALLIIIGCLIGSTLAAQHANTLPESVLGLYHNIPSKSENFEEFIKVFDLPKYAKFDETNLLGFWIEGDTNYERVVFWPQNLKFEIAFKLGEPQTLSFSGKQFEYLYTLENGESPATPVLNVSVSEIGGTSKFTARVAFTKDGFTAEFTRDSIKAKRSYRRTLPPYALGAFEADPAHPVSQAAIDFFNHAYPLPGGLKWTNNSKLWLNRHEDHYEEKMFVTPSFYIKRKFNIDEPGTYRLNGENIKYNYTILEASPNSTTLRNDISSSKGKLAITSVFDRKGSVKVTVKTDTQEFISHYKRVLPWMYYGTFEDIPEKAENWEEALKRHGAQDVLKKATVELSEAPEHKYHKKVTVEGEEPVETTFVLGEPVVMTCKKTGKTITTRNFYYKYEVDNQPTLMTAFFAPGKNPFMGITQIFNGQRFQATVVYNQEGRDTISRRTFTRKGAAVTSELPNVV